MKDCVGKLLKDVALDHNYHGKGITVLRLRSLEDTWGKPVAEGFSLKSIMATHPELACCKVVYASEHNGSKIYRVI